MELSIWARAVRLRFLSASLIAVSCGLATAWNDSRIFDFTLAALTYTGVLMAHASVDLLNDYFDYKSGIDLLTVRTPYSGGTGVLPQKLLNPSTVYKAGLALLASGTGVGILLAALRGWLVAVFVIFAVLTICIYSTVLVNVGLGELFLVVKGMIIVLGSYYVQTLRLAIAPMYTGLILGLVSSSVLFVNQFPDFQADAARGRRNLVVKFGLRKAAKLYACYPILIYFLMSLGVAAKILSPASLLSLLLIPLYKRVMDSVRENCSEPHRLVSAMRSNSQAGRVMGILLTASFLVT